MIKNCLICKKEFYIVPARNTTAKFCSIKCKVISQKDFIPWNKGKRGVQKSWSKGLRMGVLYPQCGFRKGNKHAEHPDSVITRFQKGRITPVGDKHPSWKGDSVGYVGLHDRVQKELGNVKACSCCKTTTAKLYDWANISRTYKHDLTDWIRLCRKCHKVYDTQKLPNIMELMKLRNPVFTPFP